MPDISKITLPSGTTYDIKDAVARELAAGGLQFRGVTTTTTITDGSTTSTYVIGGETITAKNGDLVIIDNKEFVYSTVDNKWHEFGDKNDLPTASSTVKGGIKTHYNDLNSATQAGNPASILVPTANDIFHTDTIGALVPIATTSTAGVLQIGEGFERQTMNVPGIGDMDTNIYSVATMTGATNNTAGTFGAPPAPQAGDQVRYLRGDGTWAVIEASELSPMAGATSSANGSAGTVPQPMIADRNKVLRGDANWVALGFSGAQSNVAVTVTTNTSGNYQPAGEINLTTTNKTPTISLKTAGTTGTIHNPTSVTVAKTVVAAAPGATAPANAITYYSVSGETLSLYQLGYTTGASITTSDVTVKTGDGAYQSNAIAVPSSAAFTGTKVQLAGTTTANGSITMTPAGT